MVCAVVGKGAGAGELLSEGPTAAAPAVLVGHATGQVAVKPSRRVGRHAVRDSVGVGPLDAATGVYGDGAGRVGRVGDGHACGDGPASTPRGVRAAAGTHRAGPTARSEPEDR